MIELDFFDCMEAVDQDPLGPYRDQVGEIHKGMEEASLEGSDFLGWLHYPSSLNPEEISEILDYGKKLKEENRRIFCLGIGGSFLGALAAISALVGPRSKVSFYGKNFSALDLEEGLEDYRPSQDHLIIISKSGTTMETAVAFRLFRDKAYRELGQEAYGRFTAITDGKKGALFDFATENGIKKYVVPEDMGGRYSVLSPVGLLPMAAGGIDISALLQGARDMEETLMEEDLERNPAYTYGVLRRAMAKRGKLIEVFAIYEPRLFELSNWYKQLFGESEGKDGGGILPYNLVYSTDLHSMGQFVQEGPRTMFETVLWIKEPLSGLTLAGSDSPDGLGDFAGMKIDQMNKVAMMGTRKAHVKGGVPNISLAVDRLDAYHLGGIFYFFEKACGMSAYLQGINPFNQPGVEAYKKEMKLGLKDLVK